MIFLVVVVGIYMANICIQRSRFSHWLLFLTGIVGVTLHEFSHYIVAKLVRFKITRVCFFKMPTRAEPSLGYVMFTRPKGVLGAVGHVLVSIAPLLVGALVLYAATQLGFTEQLANQLQTSSLMDYPSILYSTFMQASYSELCILFCIASITLYMLPSFTDIKGALEGSVYIGGVVYLLFALGVGFAFSLSDFTLGSLEVIGSLMSFGLFVSLPIALVAILTIK